MGLIIAIPMFLLSCFLLYYASQQMVSSLSRIAVYLKWREFILAFFIMAFAVSVPNFFVGIISAIKKVPELSFGDVLGGNIFDLALALGLATILTKNGISSESRTVQASALFTIVVAVMPIALIYDGVLGMGDGIALVLIYILYSTWLFSKSDRFTRPHERKDSNVTFKQFIADSGILLIGILFLLLGAKGIVDSSIAFSEFYGISLGIIGVLIVGTGNSLPELFFVYQAAKNEEEWMILGDLMGCVVVTSTLVLGIVAMIEPIVINTFSAFFVARFFLVLAALVFYIALKTDKKVSKKEGMVLLFIYLIFVILEILMS